MKETYNEPVMEIVTFSAADVITTSIPSDTPSIPTTPPV